MVTIGSGWVIGEEKCETLASRKLCSPLHLEAPEVAVEFTTGKWMLVFQ